MSVVFVVEPAEGEAPAEPEPPRVISADALRQLGEQWDKFVQEGVFVVLVSGI